MTTRKQTCFYCSDCNKPFDTAEQLFEHVKSQSHIDMEAHLALLPRVPVLEDHIDLGLPPKHPCVKCGEPTWGRFCWGCFAQ